MIVRLSDFKSNEYANLIGGERYEPHEENPMLGFRGASRYVDETFRPCFELECRAMKRVRDDDGADERADHGAVRAHARRKAEQVIELLAQNGLQRGENGLQDHHDVRAADERAARRGVPRALRRHSRSAPTT